MAEQKNSMPPRRPGGPGHGPRSHGYQRPQNLRGTVGKLLAYIGRFKAALIVVAVLLAAGAVLLGVLLVVIFGVWGTNYDAQAFIYFQF